jgi:hypothetical protein
MSRLDQNLLKKLTHGKCFLMLGSGVSINSGYPSWVDLAKKVLQYAKDKTLLSDKDIQIIDTKLKKTNSEDLLNVFELLSEILSKQKLVSIVNIVFDNAFLINNTIYEEISKWPVNCYLTTNYDSEIKKYLDRTDDLFLEYGNNPDDFRLLTSNCEKFIFKIHGSFSDPENFIITKADYDRILCNEKYEYWREKISSLLHMCTVVLIGYSAKDPDFKEQLKRARKLADSNNPIYMFAADMTSQEIERNSIENNIKVISYKTKNGSHEYLKTLINQYSSFIPKRNSNLVNISDEKIDETEFASAVFIYSHIQSPDNEIISKALANCILNTIKNHPTAITQEEIITYLREQKITTDVPKIKETIINLTDNKYIISINNSLTLTDQAKSLLTESAVKIKDYKDRFDNYCTKYLARFDLGDDSFKVKDIIRKGLEIIFRKRGIEIARKLFIDDTSEIVFTFDIENSLSSMSKELTEKEYDAFVSLSLSIFQTPSKEIRDYLSLICNGYFVYHALGHDTFARKERLDILKRNKIFIDSNILIPLIALDAQNYKYANELVQLLKSVNKDIYITENLLNEVIKHAEWAVNKFYDKPIYNLDAYNILLEENNYKQNLFIEGALARSLNKGYINFDSYFEDCFGNDYKIDLNQLIRSKLIRTGIKIVSKEDFINTDDKTEDLFTSYAKKIENDRMKNQTYRSLFQCETEAELLLIAKKEPISFLTQTTNLKKIDDEKRISHCSPEGVYRFLQINRDDVDLDNLYNCMLGDMYNNGFAVVNEEMLRKIAPPYIHQAELEIKEMKKLDMEEINNKLSEGLIDEKKYDYTLPFYSSQVQYYANSLLTRKTAENNRSSSLLEKRKEEMQLTESERKEFERMKQKKEQRKKLNRNKRNKKGKKKH